MDAASFRSKKSALPAFIRVYPRLSAVAVLALLMTGCADLQWHKPGAAQATAEQELERCRQEARVRAGWEALPVIALSQERGADPFGRPIVVQSHQRDAERLMAEQNLTRTCMRGKGYDLIPAEKR